MRLKHVERLHGIFLIKRKTFINFIKRDLNKLKFYTMNHKKFSNNNQYENFKSTKSSNPGSIEEIIGNSQKSNFGNSNDNQMYNQVAKKRSKLTFLRDGMVISFHLRKVNYSLNILEFKHSL